MASVRKWKGTATSSNIIHHCVNIPTSFTKDTIVWMVQQHCIYHLFWWKCTLLDKKVTRFITLIGFLCTYNKCKIRTKPHRKLLKGKLRYFHLYYILPMISINALFHQLKSILIKLVFNIQKIVVLWSTNNLPITFNQLPWYWHISSINPRCEFNAAFW